MAVIIKSSKLKDCLAGRSAGRVQVVGGLGKEQSVGGSKHLGPAKFKGLVEQFLGVTERLVLEFLGGSE